MKPLPGYVKGLLVLGAFATTVPISGGYFVAFWLTLWLIAQKTWRLALVANDDAFDDAFMRNLTPYIKPIHWGVAVMVASHIIAAALGYFFSPWSKPLGQTVMTLLHICLKLGVLWFVVSTAMIAAKRLGFSPRKVVPWFVGWMVLYFIYCLVQRSTGIDWSHGFSARLPSHRFSYGVYRISGFIGHPLTLAYNLMLMFLASLAMATHLKGCLEKKERLLWAAVAALAAAILLISGSRYVLIVIAVAWILCEGKRVWKYRYWIAGLGVLAGVVLYFEGSMVGRFGELFDERVPLLTRFPRLVFWQMHWQMFLDHPIIGVTRAGDDDAMVAYYTAAGYHDNMYTAHNMFLQSMADTGLIGLTGLLAFLGGFGISIRRLRRLAGGSSGPATSVAYLLAATVVCGLMQNDLRDSGYIYSLWFFLSLLLVQSAELAARTAQSDGDERKPPENFQSPADRPHSAPYLPG